MRQSAARGALLLAVAALVVGGCRGDGGSSSAPAARRASDASVVADAEPETAEDKDNVAEPAPRQIQEVAEAIVERAHGLGRRGEVISVVGVFEGAAGDSPWLLDRRYPGGCVGLRLELAKGAAAAEGRELIATGAFWPVGAHWVFRVSEFEQTPQADAAIDAAVGAAVDAAAVGDAAVGDAAVGDAAIGDEAVGAPNGETRPETARARRAFEPSRHLAGPEPSADALSYLEQGSRGRFVQVKVLEAPARFGEGWLLADLAAPEQTARAQLPGESAIYGGQDFRSADEAWPLRRGDTLFLKISWVRKTRDGTLQAFGVAECPRKAPGKAILALPGKTKTESGPLNKPSTPGGTNDE